MSFLRRSLAAFLVSAALCGPLSAQEVPATVPGEGAPAEGVPGEGAPAAAPAAPAPGGQSATSGTVRSTHGAWSVVCESAPGAPQEQCGRIRKQ